MRPSFARSFSIQLPDVERIAFDKVDAGVLSGRSWLFTNAYYVYQHEGRPVLGEVKVALGNTDGAGLLCTLDGVGYSNSFLASFHKALATLDTPQLRAAQQKTPQLTELHRFTPARIVGAGITETQLWREPNGSDREVELGQVVMRTPSFDLTILDRARVQIFRGDTPVRIYDGRWLNGVEHHSLTLEPLDEPHRYRVHGSKSEARYVQDLTLDAQPESPVHLITQLAQLEAAPAGSSVANSAWDPNHAIDRLRETRFTRTDAGSPYNVTAESANMRAEVRLSEAGSLLEFHADNATFARVWTQGALR